VPDNQPPAPLWKKIAKWALPIIGVLLFSALANPFIDDLVEFIRPTSAEVIGIIKREGLPVPSLAVVMDNKEARTSHTNQYGQIFIEDVSAGSHTVDIYGEGRNIVLSDYIFVVTRSSGEEEFTFDLASEQPEAEGEQQGTDATDVMLPPVGNTEFTPQPNQGAPDPQLDLIYTDQLILGAQPEETTHLFTV